MAKKQITISIDEQWLDAIDRNANPGFCLTQTLESLTVDFVAKVLVPEPEYAAVCRTIAEEKLARKIAIIDKARKYNIITVIEEGTFPTFMIPDDPRILFSILEKVREYPGINKRIDCLTFCDMFPGKLLWNNNDSFDTKVAEYLFHPELSDVACIYSIDLDKRQLGILKKWSDINPLRAFPSWRFFDLDRLCEYRMVQCFPNAIWQYLDYHDLHLPIRETPDIYITGMKRLVEKDVRFEDEVDQDGNLLSFYLGTYYDPDAVFGTDVCTDANDHMVNAYAYFDLDKDDVVDELSVVVSPAAAFPDEVYKYRLTLEEKALLRREMDAHLKAPDSQGHTTTLAQLRAEYINEKGKEKKQR